MKWFTSIWMKIRKSNGLPTNNVLIPLEEKVVTAEVKPKRTRKPKEIKVVVK